MSERRRFNQRERAALYLAADGRCTECGRELKPGWHADHETPWSRGGKTDVINGQALCPECNLKKGNHMADKDPYSWQRRFHEKWLAVRPDDFLVSATPGSGKTYASLSLGVMLLAERSIERVIAVVPTDALREQWADEAAKVGVQLMPVRDAADYEKDGYDGCVVTYQQLATGAGADLLRRVLRKPTLVILDEIHHAGDKKSWGDKLRHAVELATHRLALTGTPWRRDKRSPIPFVNYADTVDKNGQDITVARVDFAYEYGTAVGDGVCRRIEFHAYDGEARWVDFGEIVEAQLGDELDDADVSAVFDAVLDPRQPWIAGLLTKADDALNELRREFPSAGGLVIADDQRLAKNYRSLLHRITGAEPSLAISEDGHEAKRAIEAFRDGASKWLVSVRMVSEGIDIPRLAVGVYATRSKTPLFFRQVVGRFVRITAGGDHNSLLFIPSVPALLRHAREIEDELRHELELAAERERAEREESEQQTFELRQILSASDIKFHSAIMSGDDVTPDEIEAGRRKCIQFGIPTSCAVAVARMLRESGAPVDVTVTPKPSQDAKHRREKLLRDELESLARRLDYKAGAQNGSTNGQLFRLFGPRKKATIESLEEQILLVHKWMSEL